MRMVRVGGLVIVLQVTAIAGTRGRGKAVAGVAQVASGCGMRSGQRESRDEVVVERGGSPVGRVVALGAVGWKSCRHMIRVIGRLKVGLVAVKTCCRRPREAPRVELCTGSRS